MRIRYVFHRSKETYMLCREYVMVFTQVVLEKPYLLPPEFVFKGKGTRTKLDPLSEVHFNFFSIRVFLHKHSWFIEQEWKGEAIYLTFLYHLHPLRRHLDISQAITAESPSLYMASSRIRAGTFAWDHQAFTKQSESIQVQELWNLCFRQL